MKVLELRLSLIRNRLLAATLALLPLPAIGAVIASTGTWDGATSTGTFGEGSTDTYGQTFLAPATETVLESVRFWLDDRLNPGPVQFAAYVMQWSDPVGILQAGHAVGPILYASSAVASTNNGGQGGMEAFLFSTGGLELIAGQKYVAFLSSSLFWDGISGGAEVGTTAGSSYADGDLVIQSTGKEFNALITGGGWNNLYDRDLAFGATFSAVPVPPAVWLFSSAVASFGWLRRRSTGPVDRDWRACRSRDGNGRRLHDGLQY